jgi:hypothetical protein
MALQLHSWCPSHQYVFCSDSGTNPRWLNLSLPGNEQIRAQLRLEKYFLHVRRCDVCTDELLASLGLLPAKTAA